MATTKISRKFFSSTRGQIVHLLRGAARTVDELAKVLELTDNAVRAHLATLERDGLVHQTGVRRGARKPHLTYELTHEAEHLFPKSYDALLNVLLSVVKEKLAPDEMEDVLREVGRRIAAGAMINRANGADLLARAQEAANLLEALGGAARIETEDGKIRIRSESCPFATAVAAHPEVCVAAETFVAQITGGRVREHCNKVETPPRCLFEITEKKKRAAAGKTKGH